jgi:glycosyltransferase involved in cell wall biosynthesis
MRILALSHSAVVPAYRSKFGVLAELSGWEWHLALPHAWPEGGKDVAAPAPGMEGALRTHVLPCRLRGRVGFAHLAGLDRLAQSLRPDWIYAEEEPFSLAAWQALRAADACGARFGFYTWENLDRRYKPPLNAVRRRVLKGTRLAVAGNGAAETLLRTWGYGGALLRQPQYGIDPGEFGPGPRPEGPFTAGYFGRLVPEKGVDVLLKAAAKSGVRVRIGGGGPEESPLKKLASDLGIQAEFSGFVPFERRAGFYRGLHALVLPSLRTRTWEEQFGRVLAEAMACGVPCVGADSGAIPEVLGDAGLVTPTGDVDALAGALLRLRDESGLAGDLAVRACARARDLFTARGLAESLVRSMEAAS